MMKLSEVSIYTLSLDPRLRGGDGLQEYVSLNARRSLLLNALVGNMTIKKDCHPRVGGGPGCTYHPRFNGDSLK